MRKNTSPTENLIAKLEQPVHINYISEYILKIGMDETKKKIDFLIEEGLIQESKYGKEYYVRVNLKK